MKPQDKTSAICLSFCCWPCMNAVLFASCRTVWSWCRLVTTAPICLPRQLHWSMVANAFWTHVLEVTCRMCKWADSMAMRLTSALPVVVYRCPKDRVTSYTPTDYGLFQGTWEYVCMRIYRVACITMPKKWQWMIWPSFAFKLKEKKKKKKQNTLTAILMSIHWMGNWVSTPSFRCALRNWEWSSSLMLGGLHEVNFIATEWSWSGYRFFFSPQTWFDVINILPKWIFNLVGRSKWCSSA